MLIIRNQGRYAYRNASLGTLRDSVEERNPGTTYLDGPCKGQSVLRKLWTVDCARKDSEAALK